MLAKAADSLPTGPEWTYEVKWDGYRTLAIKTGPNVQLLSRNHKDLTRAYPDVVAALVDLSTESAILDGEIVALDASGRPSFRALQHRRTKSAAIAYCAFDMLQVGSESLLEQSLDERRRRLKSVVAKGTRVFLSEPLPGSPAHIEQEIRKLGLEGVVAKRRDSRYRPGERTDSWLKVKFSPRQEFVIGGYTPDTRNFDSVLVGYYEGRRLCFAGRVRAGFTPHTRAEVFRRIADRHARTCPFVNLPNSAKTSNHWGEGISQADMATFRWVKPAIVIDVSFVEWTEDGLLRHSRFVGLRDDRLASDVRREAVASERTENP
jgi:DNA ligase D-like protein (predicted ligase)